MGIDLSIMRIGVGEIQGEISCHNQISSGQGGEIELDIAAVYARDCAPANAEQVAQHVVSRRIVGGYMVVINLGGVQRGLNCGVNHYWVDTFRSV